MVTVVTFCRWGCTQPIMILS